MASVTVKDVSKAYGSVKVMDGLDLAIADGEFVVLLGPSGCGKSTLLRMIAGLEPVTSGEVAIGDRVVNRLHPKDRNIAMVFQNYALYAHMTVFDNMAFSMQLKNRPKAEIRQKVGWAASILNLEPYLAALSARIVGRATPARRHGPGNRARSRRLPVRRAASAISTPNCGCRCAPRSRNCTSG